MRNTALKINYNQLNKKKHLKKLLKRSVNEIENLRKLFLLQTIFILT